MKYTLPALSYDYSALEPHIDARTMEIHHTKHHQTYVNKLNEALEKHPELENRTLENMLLYLNEVPEDIRKAVQNHGGGHCNHSFFWKIMGGPNMGGEPTGELKSVLLTHFESVEKFKEEFSAAALSVFGSGWAWLVKNPSRTIKIITTPNQDCPLMQNYTPILGLDLWEHAYYLNYQNKRLDYVSAWWNVVNWEEAEKNFVG